MSEKPKTEGKKKKNRQIDKDYKGDIVLHIGNTGGSYLGDILSKMRPDKALVNRFSHKMDAQTAIKKWPNSRIVFAVRDPLSLFVSAFNSRLRKGQPRYNIQWSPAEAVAFRCFGTPNDLAEALSSNDPSRQACAEFAMLGIMHVNKCLNFYLTSADFLEENRKNIGFILAQPTLDADVEGYLEQLKFDVAKLQEIRAEAVRHETPKGFDTQLSPEARENLSHWYARDIRIYEWCIRNKDEINSSRARNSA